MYHISYYDDGREGERRGMLIIILMEHSRNEEKVPLGMTELRNPITTVRTVPVQYEYNLHANDCFVLFRRYFFIIFFCSTFLRF